MPAQLVQTNVPSSRQTNEGICVKSRVILVFIKSEYDNNEYYLISAIHAYFILG